ncbi:MAG: N-acetylmuramoyl-L-alanine amidase [Oscillospiraceae bacterium]|nr:N-acetylmuramoyl-L-alanine amidase [Oscillospiraceae bacterium]
MRAGKKMLPVYLCTMLIILSCAVYASQGVTVLAGAFADQTPRRLPTLVLDPGHGGEDGGAVSPNGVRESTLNLEISLRTRDLLRFLGLPVVMTREMDVSIHSPEAGTISEKKVSDLKNRVQFVSEQADPILVSIHQNMFAEAKYYGAQVFYAGTEGSQAMAEGMQALFSSKLDPTNHRQAKPCENVYLLSKINCPGVLVECGFLSNPREEGLLQTEEYQKKLAAVLAAGLVLSGALSSIY